VRSRIAVDWRHKSLTKSAFASRDIVDTEPFPEGNLLKMLLGATFDWFDDDDDDDDVDD
jgi:hypothetical protein